MLTVFFTKCSLCEHERLLSKILSYLINLKLLNHTVKIINPAFTSLNEWIENTLWSPTPLLLCKSHKLNVRAFPPNSIQDIFVAMCFAILKTRRIGVLTQFKCFLVAFQWWDLFIFLLKRTCFKKRDLLIIDLLINKSKLVM